MTGISTLGSALSRINLINQQTETLDRLTVQFATRKITQKFEGLENNVLTSQRARANVQSLDTYINNITNADRRISLTLRSIEEFQSQSENFSNALVQFSQESVHQKGEIISFDDPLTPEVEDIRVGMSSADSDVDLEALRQLAGNIYDFLGDLLNTQETDRYLLSGADSLTQPYSDLGTLDAAISSLVTRWKDETLPPGTNLTNDELVSALTSRDVADDPNALTDTIVGYSPALSAGNVADVFVRVDERSEVNYTALANEDPFRDLLVATAFLSNEALTPIADVYAEPFTLGDPTLADGAPGATLDEQKDNFFAVFNEMVQVVNDALDDIDGIRFRLENSRARILETRETHIIDKNALLNTVDNIENVDVNEIALTLNSLQTQLEASFRVTASIQNLSLVNFI